MNQFQLILLLLLTKSNIPKPIQNYLSGLKATTCSFNLIPFKDIPGLNKIIFYLDFSLQNKDLDIFGIFSGSAIVNNFSFICILLIIGLIQVLFTLISKCFKKANSIIAKKCLASAHQFFNYSIYIRLFIEVNQFMLLSCTSEIKGLNTSSLSSIISLLISFVFAFICVCFLFISFLSWTKYEVSENLPENYPFKEFFNGIALKSSAKLYSTIFLLRRMTLVGLLIFGSSLSNIYLIVPMIVCQTVYLIVVVAIRPFKEVKNNIIEILNECFYFTLVSMLAFYNEISRWSQFIQNVYLGIIIMNSLTIISVLITILVSEFGHSSPILDIKINLLIFLMQTYLAFLITQTRNLKQKCNKKDIAPKPEVHNENNNERRDFSSFRKSNASQIVPRNQEPESVIAYQEESKISELESYINRNRYPPQKVFSWMRKKPLSKMKNF